MPNTRPSSEGSKASILALAMLCVYFFASWEIRPLFFSNQNTYFLQGLRLGGVAGLQSDWLSHTRPPHIVFTWVVAALQSHGILTLGVRVMEVILYTGLVGAMWILSASSDRGQTARSTSIRFLICGAFLVLLMEPGPWSVLFNWEGLAHQFIFGGYLEPGEFGIAIVAAIALFSLERYRLSIACLVLAVAFHASYLIPCSVLAATMGADLFYRKQRQESLVLLAAFGVGVSPIVLYGLSFGGDPASTARANALLAREIIPQHAWPAFWISPLQIVKFTVMTVGTLLAWRHVSRSVALAMTSSLLLIAFGTAFVYFTENAYVGLLFPWRASAYLYPISLFVLLVSLASIAEWLAGRIVHDRARVILEWGALVFAALLAVEAVREITVRKPGPDFSFAIDATRLSRVDDQIIIPADGLDLWNRFRLLAMRPTYVDRKSHPYLAAEVLEWKRRIDAVNAFYRLSPDEQPRRCHEMGARFYAVVDEDPNHLSRPDAPKFSLVACTP